MSLSLRIIWDWGIPWCTPPPLKFLPPLRMTCHSQMYWFSFVTGWHRTACSGTKKDMVKHSCIQMCPAPLWKGYTKEQEAKNVKVTASSPFSSCSSCSMQSGSTTPQRCGWNPSKWVALGLPNCKYIGVGHFHPVQRYLFGHLYTTWEEGTLATLEPMSHLHSLSVPALHTVRATACTVKDKIYIQ